MPKDNGKLQLPWELALWLTQLPLRSASLKLLIAMLHQQELRDGWREVDERPIVCWATFGALRARVGPKGANDGRAIRRLREELLEERIVSHCEVLRHERAHALQWMVAPAIAAQMSCRMSRDYVLLDLDELAEMKTREEIGLYIFIRREWGKKAPQFDIALAPETCRADLRRYHRALPRLAELFGARFHVTLCYRTDAPVPDRLNVKCEHAETRWFDGALEKMPPDARRWIIDPRPDGE
jgi:hypothetical protein